MKSWFILAEKKIITFQENETEGYPLFQNKLFIKGYCECYKTFI
jgi:hypothetical protein